MPRVCLAMLSLAVLAACGDSGQPLAPTTAAPKAPLVSATTEITNEQIPYSSLQFVSCANGGAGEDVLLEGSLHNVSRATEASNGNFSVTLHSNPQGITGTGQITGDKYQGTGSSIFRFSTGPGGRETITEAFLVVGPGPDNNFTIHAIFHVTVNADGTVTSEVDSFSTECS